jgi:hypothetical protein
VEAIPVCVVGVQAGCLGIAGTLVKLMCLPTPLAGEHGERLVDLGSRFPVVTERDAEQSLEVHVWNRTSAVPRGPRRRDALVRGRGDGRVASGPRRA